MSLSVLFRFIIIYFSDNFHVRKWYFVYQLRSYIYSIIFNSIDKVGNIRKFLIILIVSLLLIYLEFSVE